MLVVAAIIFILFGFLFSPLRTSRFRRRSFLSCRIVYERGVLMHNVYVP